MSVYQGLKKLLFQLDPELAHHLTLKGLNLFSKCLETNLPEKPRMVMGIRFPNPVGLAAGLDKDGLYIRALSRLGFGFIEIGTITPKPQAGNPKPRLFRLIKDEALINRMGFNNAGLGACVATLRRMSYQGVLGINIGKNKDTPNNQAIADYLLGLRGVYPYASYITVNISSPNTPGLRELQTETYLRALLNALKNEQADLTEQYQRYVPVAVKIAPDLSAEDIQAIAAILLEHRIDGVIATNTTLSRFGLQASPDAAEAGGLSGKPLMAQSTWVIEQLRAHLGTRIPIIGVGGILSGDDAAKKIRAGAQLVQLYTGLIYRGPQLIREVYQAFPEHG